MPQGVLVQVQSRAPDLDFFEKSARERVFFYCRAKLGIKNRTSCEIS